MKCPYCDTFNENNNTTCKNCGCTLEENKDKNNQESEIESFNIEEKVISQYDDTIIPKKNDDKTSFELQNDISLNLNSNPNVEKEEIHNLVIPQNVTTSVSTIENKEEEPKLKMTTNNKLPFLIKYIKDSLIKPISTFLDNEDEMTNGKTAFSFSALVVILLALITLIQTMITSVFVKSYFSNTTSLNLENLFELDYIGIICNSIITNLCIIGGVSLVYYLVASIFKKNLNYLKLLSICSTSILPYVILGVIAYPILTLLWAPFGVFSLVIGLTYSSLIFISLIKREINFDNPDMNIYFHLICISTIIIVGFYLLFEMVF